MNLEEFSAIQNKVISLVIDFEQTERRINFLNNVYNLKFYNELEQQRYLQYENEYLIKAIAMGAEGKTEAEVQAFLRKCKMEFALLIDKFQKQAQFAQNMEEQLENYTKEDLEQTDASFMEYCSKYHPLVKAQSTPLDRSIYSSLIMLYRSGNIVGFKNVLKECSSNLIATSFSEEEYDKVARLYQETIEYLNSIKQNRKMEFPLTKEDIFNKEELMTRELIYLREKNYQAREMNKSLQADFKLQFPFEFSL